MHARTCARRESQISFRSENSKLIKIWPRRQNILRAHARKCARQNIFYHRILHEILHLPDTLDVFISLKLIAVDGFEVGARRCTCEHNFVKKCPPPLTK